MNSGLLVLIEQLFSEQRDKEALQKVEKLAFQVQLTWERESQTFRDGLARIRWWEVLFERTHPITFERLKRSIPRRVNAAALFSPPSSSNVWRDLLVLLAESDRLDRSVWQVAAGFMAAVNPADEYGIDQFCTIATNSFRIKITNNGNERAIDVASPALLTHNKELVMFPINAWSVPFQQAVIVLLQHFKTKEQELVWIPTSQPLDRNFELSNWALNHNNLTENPEDFAAPPFLLGDSTLKTPPIIAAIESRTDVPNAKTALCSVTIRHNDTLLFDQLKQEDKKQPQQHWRMMLTDELFEPRRIPISSACFVLDSLLLFASNDGILRAHPRGNVQSTYHVEDLKSLVPQMTSLYNVVALIHSYNVLEVRRVEKQDADPFIRFQLLYRDQMADATHAPLLYGPFVLYGSLDGSWYRVKYDSPNHVKEELKVPFKTGWKVEAVKNANWRFWNILLKNNNKHEEYLLYSGGLPLTEQKASLIALCIDCGIRATYLCRACRSVGFCTRHGEQAVDGHEHLEQCL
jgi:hypothetical protein